MDEIMPREDEGLLSPPVEPPPGLVRIQPRTIDTCIGTIRRWPTVPNAQKAFLALGLAELSITLAYSIFSVIHYFYSNSQNSGDDFIIAVVLTINIVFCYHHIFDGIMREKPYDLIVFLIANGLVLVYVVENYTLRCTQTPDKFCFNTMKFSRLILSCVVIPPVVIIGVVVVARQLTQGEFIFRLVGPSANLQRACRFLFASISIIVLDLQVLLSFIAVLVYAEIRRRNMRQVLVISCDIPYCLLWSLSSYYVLRYESKKLVVFVTILGVIAEPVYFVYNLCTSFDSYVEDADEVLDVTILSIGGLFILVRAVHLYLMCACSRNFGQGLNRIVFSRQLNVETTPLLG